MTATTSQCHLENDTSTFNLRNWRMHPRDIVSAKSTTEMGNHGQLFKNKKNHCQSSKYFDCTHGKIAPQNTMDFATNFQTINMKIN